MAVVAARGLRKTFGKTAALDGFDLQIEEGRVLGLIGPNGSGKTTALLAMSGLVSCDGELKVLGRDPWTERNQLMRDVSFVADVAVLPRWLRVKDAIDYMAGVHPRFDRARAESLLARTLIRGDVRVRELSKGMITQLHLALVLAIDAKLLVFDEPTIGLDLPFRKQFYDSVLSFCCDRSRTVILTTHQVDEIENILTDVAFIDCGRIVFAASTEDLETRYWEVKVNPPNAAAAQSLNPIHQRRELGRSVLLFEGVDRLQLAELGDVRRPSISDLFLACMAGRAQTAQEATR